MTTHGPAKTRQSRTIKEKRITARVTGDLKERAEEAASLSGRTLTDFIVEAIQEKADEVIDRQRILELTERDMDALLAALDKPVEPNAAMRRSVARWHEHGAPE
jgi:uncharacterized protein (DUF1778 family)